MKHLLGGFEVRDDCMTRLHAFPLDCVSHYMWSTSAQAMTFLKADKFNSLTVKPHEYDKYFRCV